ncbi:MAG: precorrin-2 dehydrogenase/sirohydrochlorin ferrochelatase family protein [Methanosarcinaceae archaeon]
MSISRKYLPLFLDVGNRKVVIFGGGSVGERKATFFCEYADTYVLSAGFTSALHTLRKEGKVELIEHDLSSIPDEGLSELIDGAFLVIPATSDSSLNQRIIDVAKCAGVLINPVEYAGDVVIPSVIRRGDLIIGISTLGKSPALSKYTRRKLETVITPEYGEMVRLQEAIRSQLKQRVSDQATRRTILWEILDDGRVWDALTGSYEKAYNIAFTIMVDRIENTG